MFYLLKLVKEHDHTPFSPYLGIVHDGHRFTLYMSQATWPPAIALMGLRYEESATFSRLDAWATKAIDVM